MKKSLLISLGCSLVFACASTTKPGLNASAPDRSKLPEPQASTPWRAPAPEIWTMANGLQVVHLHQGHTPLVAYRLLFPGGASTDPIGAAGLTSLMADMLDEGAGDKNALELNKALQNLATDYGAEANQDSLSLKMDLLNQNADASLALLADIVLHPSFDTEEFDRLKKRRIASALAGESSADLGRAIVLHRVLFGDGFAATPRRGVRSSIEKLELEQLKSHYQAMVQPDGARLVVVGGLKKSELQPMLEKHFAAWSGKSTTTLRPPAQTNHKRGIYIVDYPGAEQTGISVAKATGGIHSKDFFESKVFSRVFGSAFTSRLNMNIREDKGYGYGAYAWFQRFSDAGYHVLSARVETPSTALSLVEMYREIEEVCGVRPITQKEHKEAVSGLHLGFAGRFESIAHVAGQLSNLALYDLGAQWYGDYTQKIQQVSQDAAQKAAQSYCQGDDYVVVMAGDKKVIEPMLSQWDLPHYYFDAQGREITQD